MHWQWQWVCITFPLYGMHWQWHGMVWYALALAMAMVWYALEMVWYGMVCISLPFPCMVWYGMVWYALEMVMVCIGNGNSMHWKWYAMPFHCMVCIGSGMVWYGMHWHWKWKWQWYGMHWKWYSMVWYALAMEMICIGMVCIPLPFLSYVMLFLCMHMLHHVPISRVWTQNSSKCVVPLVFCATLMQEHHWQARRGRTTQHVGVLPELQLWQLQSILKSTITQHRNLPLEARLNQCRNLPFETRFENRKQSKSFHFSPGLRLV
jgi:hypothetical protein